MPTHTNGPAFFLGIFDPFHKGHLETARRALKQYKFDKIYFVNYNNHRHRPDKDITNVFERYKIINQAIQNKKGFDNIAIEFDTKTPTDVYHIVTILKKMFKLDKVNLIFGDESFLRFNNWYRAHDVANMSNFYINPIAKKIHIIHGNFLNILQDNFHQFLKKIKPRSVLDIHSTTIRKLAEKQQDITQDLVTPITAQYIQQTKLYQKELDKKVTNINQEIIKKYPQRKITVNAFPTMKKVYMTNFPEDHKV